MAKKERTTEREPPRYDPRGFKAKCFGCGEWFYIPWETMCDAGYCDACVKNFDPTKPERHKT